MVAGGSAFGSFVRSSNGDLDPWPAKYDSSGRQLWKRQWGSGDEDQARGMATDTAGDVDATGCAEGSFGGPDRGPSDAFLPKVLPAR